MSNDVRFLLLTIKDPKHGVVLLAHLSGFWSSKNLFHYYAYPQWQTTFPSRIDVCVFSPKTRVEMELKIKAL